MIIAYIIAGGIILFGVCKIVKNKKKVKDIIFRVVPIKYLIGSDIRYIFNVINKIRKLLNLKVLESDKKTTLLAIERNKEMIFENKVSHELAADEIGELLELGADSVGEIIGYKYRTAEACINAWMKSEGHYRQIIKTDYDWCGVSVETDKNGYKYYCVLFGNE